MARRRLGRSLALPGTWFHPMVCLPSVRQGLEFATPQRCLPGGACATLGALKRKQIRSQPPDPAKADPAPVGSGSPAFATPARSRARLWVFRLLALVFPLGLIAIIELVLRLVGSGYPTHFFLSARQSGTNTPGLDADGPVCIENQRFGWRFFPAAIARTPEPLLLSQRKPQNTCRIFVFGESAAMGDPAPEYGFSRILEVLLRERYPGLAFEVVNVAMTAINSHVIREIAKDCAHLQGDVWIVYMGNNEVVGPYGSGTVFTSQAPGLAFIRASIALKATRIGQWLDRLRQQGSQVAEWEGMEMFLQQQVRADDPKMKRVYAHFQRNLEDLVALAGASGAQILLSTVPSNLKDCPPFASMHKPGLSQTQRAEWQQLFEAGNKLVAEQKFTEALAPFQSAARIDPDYAELPFLMGRCLLALGKPAEARQSFARARDLDTLRFRADTRLDEIIRQVAAANSRVTLLDAVQVFQQQTSNSVVGGEFFHEHVHLNFAGNYLLACSMEKQLEPLLPAWVQKIGPGKPLALPAEECARRLALTDWNRLQIAEEMRKRLLQPPFTNQWGQLARDQHWRQTIATLKAAEDPANLQQAAKEARLAVQQAPSDWRLRHNLARLLEAAGDTKGAAGAWREVQRLLPHGVEAPFHLGNLAQALGQNGEAAEYFREVLRRKPEAVEALNGLGLVLAAEGKTFDAVRQYEAALKFKPRFVEARVNLGQVMANLGRVDEARGQYEAALRQDSNCVAAHINLGKLLSAQGRKEEAAAHYQEALRARPDDAVAHFNLANVLADLGRSTEAITHYLAAVQAKPDLAEARYNLGHELARLERASEALDQFSVVVKLKPDWAEAHFNLGVALARARRLDEAAAQFRETLRLQPSHASARQYLVQVETMRAGK